MTRLTDDRLAEFRERAQKATSGRWGAFGMMLLTGEPGMNADTAEHLADFYTQDERGRPRTFDLDHVVNMQPRNAIALIDEVIALRKAKHDLADALRLTQDYIGAEALPPIEGWSWYDALAKHAPEMLPSYVLAPHGSYGPTATLAHADTETRYAHHTQVERDDGSWVDAEPLGMIGWKAKAEERFREYGWTRLANFMARWDERALGR